MTFRVTDDNVLYLYPYYTLNEKTDQKSKEVYHVFKRNWSKDAYFANIRDDMFSAVDDFLIKTGVHQYRVAVVVMPSHSQGQYGESLCDLANALVGRFSFVNNITLIQRVEEKIKSTDGGIRTVEAHIRTLGLLDMPSDNVDVYLILDDITTTGSSLEAAKQLLIANGVHPNNIIKVAVAKTTHDDYYFG